MELSELIESVDILDYISQYTDFTEKNGEYWALSPLKDENTPSFSVRKETNSFFDFSSGIGGNVLTFIRYYDKCSMAEAVEKLKKYSGFNGKVSSRKRLAATEVAKRFAPPHNTAKKAKGTVLPDDYMERYEKRDDKLAVWEREGISRASAISSPLSPNSSAIIFTNMGKVSSSKQISSPIKSGPARVQALSPAEGSCAKLNFKNASLLSATT